MFSLPQTPRPALAALCGVALCWPQASPAAPESTAGAPRKESDLRPQFEKWGLKPRRQGGRGTCSVIVLTGGIEFALARRDGHGTRLSPEFLNWASNRKCGNRQDGGFFSDLWKGFQAFGICDEEKLPYAARFDPALDPGAEILDQAKSRLTPGLKLHWIKEWDVKTGLDDRQLAAIRKTLDKGWPVCGGFRWPKREEWKDGVLQMCPPEEVFDGHSLLIVGYREDAVQPGGGVLLFRNSGGGGRDGAMPYNYARVFLNDAAWIE